MTVPLRSANGARSHLKHWKLKAKKDRAEWTQIRYLSAAPLSALKDPDLHNWSTKGKANI
jgi:hypothetical protein